MWIHNLQLAQLSSKKPTTYNCSCLLREPKESTVYALSDYIETKGAESHFEPIAEDCTLKCKALNTETIRVLAEAPVFAGGFY